MKKLYVALASMALSGAAVAGPAWTYVDGGLVFGDSGGDDTALGGKLTGSFGLDIFHGNLSYVDVSDVAQDVDFSAFRVGLGIHPAITDNTDMVLEIGYTDAEFDIDDVSDEPEPSGVDLVFGVRSMIADNFELNAAAVLFYGDTDTGDDDDLQEAGIRIGGQYFFTDNFSVNATATQGWVAEAGTDDSIQIGARFSF